MFWPPGHVKVVFGGGSTVREPLTEPFLPDVNVPCAVTVPVTVDLLAALGHFCPWFRQAYTALASAETVTVIDTFEPSPAILKSELRVPLELTPLTSQLRKWGFCARTVVAMKPRAIMAQVRILNFFIGLLLMIFVEFCLVPLLGLI